MQQVNEFVEMLNGILFHDGVVYALLATGVLFTLWSGFGQYKALTHGVSVVRGKYDNKDDPGAINHFQALSAALSATVGLGNIAGVAVAVALGGPGAVFWMWVIGVIGMALKMTEVTQSMLYRNTDDPENPHGGPMFVVKEGFKRWGLGPLGSVIGGIFVVTLLISAITGGNMFQAWNVADVTHTYFGIPQVATGIVLAVIVAAVIIGGIKRIGSVAGRIVPFMCVIYLLAALWVLGNNLGEIPAMLVLIVKAGIGLETASASGAFLGGTFGYAMMWGIKRALFSSEAGQGSAPIAHSAAKTDEPAREGVVAGLEPFIDTIVVCTLTALVILSTGAYDRGPEAHTAANLDLTNIQKIAYTNADGDDVEASGRIISQTSETLTFVAAGVKSEAIRVIPLASINTDRIIEIRAEELKRVTKKNNAIDKGNQEGAAGAQQTPLIPTASLGEGRDSPFVTVPDYWVPQQNDLPTKTAEAARIAGDWRDGDGLFILIETVDNSDTGANLDRLTGKVVPEGEGDERNNIVSWKGYEADTQPTVVIDDDNRVGIYGDYAGASLTAHAFDRVTPGLGMWLVTLASWLFAISTMISWSYYGEQGVVYLAGSALVLPYKLVYCLIIALTTVAAQIGMIENDKQLDMWTTLGLGVMLVANIPIMLIFGAQAMKAYHEYMGKLKRGEFHPHDAPSIEDVMGGKDVE